MRKFIFLLYISLSVTLLPAAENQDQELADLYTQYAISAYKTGDYEYAVKLIDKALVFADSNADALYLKSLLLRDLPGSVNEYSRIMEKCVNSGKLSYFDRNEVYYNYGLINRRLMKYENTIRIMEKLDKTRLYTNPRFIYLYADALDRSGRRAEAVKILKESVLYFHEDTDLWSLLIKIDRKRFEDIRSELILHSDPALTGLYEAVIKRTTDSDMRELLIDKYYRSGLDSYQMRIQSYMLYPRISWYEIREILSERMPENRYELEQLYRLAAKNDLLTDFSDFWQNFNGILQNDSNDDGFIDSIEEFSKGRLVKAIFDMDQNGDPESIVILDDNSVRIVFQDGVMQEIRYGKYPYVASVKQYTGDSKAEEYVMRPGHLKADLIDIDNGMLSEISMKGRSLNITDFLNKVLYVNTMKLDSNLMEKTYTYYPFGIAEEFIYGNNQIISRTFYADGKAVRSEYDNDMDGNAESTVLYKDGKAWKICSDLNGNGLYEYTELPQDGGKKYWDLDEDGTSDICEYRELNDIIRKFSTRFDGVYDVSLRVRKGKIIEIFRNGSRQKMSTDKYGQTWIGKSENILFPGDSEGVFFKENNQYYIFTYNGKRYIEGSN